MVFSFYKHPRKPCLNQSQETARLPASSLGTLPLSLISCVVVPRDHYADTAVPSRNATLLWPLK